MHSAEQEKGNYPWYVMTSFVEQQREHLGNPKTGVFLVLCVCRSVSHYLLLHERMLKCSCSLTGKVIGSFGSPCKGEICHINILDFHFKPFSHTEMHKYCSTCIYAHMFRLPER